MTIVVTALSPDTAAAQWPALRGMIDVGYAAGGDFMPEDLPNQITEGKVLLWIAVDDETAVVHAAMTTELIPMRCGLVCWMGQCAGDRMRDWSKFHTQIEEYARDEGCVKVVLKGRRGWERILDGYKIRTVTLEKALT
jgi:hypothetical protein